MGEPLAKIREQIDAKGMRKDWLAARLGIAPSTLTKHLNGERPISAERLQRIADILDVYDVDDLKSGNAA